MLFKDVMHDLQKHSWELPPCLPSRTPRGDKATFQSVCKRESTFETSQSARIASGTSLVQCKQRMSVQRLFKDTSCVPFGRHNSSQHAQVLIFLELDSKNSSISLCTRSFTASLIGSIWSSLRIPRSAALCVSNHEPVFQLQR